MEIISFSEESLKGVKIFVYISYALFGLKKT